MSTRVHDHELDTGAEVVRELLHAQRPDWADRPLRSLGTLGTDHAMWQFEIERDRSAVIRLPRRAADGDRIDREADLLRRVADSAVRDIVATPDVLHQGLPIDGVFAHPWSVLSWLDGDDAWSRRDELDQPTAADLLARLVVEIRAIEPAGLVHRSSGDRGGPMGALVERLERWLDDLAWGASELIDIGAVRRVVAASSGVIDVPLAERVPTHGDLLPGNVLVAEHAVVGAVDWGGLGIGDPAQDLAPAWSILDADAGERFRRAVGADDATWCRGRLIELEHAVGTVLYYEPRKHVLGTIMRRTLDRILDDTSAT